MIQFEQVSLKFRHRLGRKQDGRSLQSKIRRRPNLGFDHIASENRGVESDFRQKNSRLVWLEIDVQGTTVGGESVAAKVELNPSLTVFGKTVSFTDAIDAAGGTEVQSSPVAPHCKAPCNSMKLR